MPSCICANQLHIPSLKLHRFSKLDNREVPFLAGVSVVMGFESCDCSWKRKKKKVPCYWRCVGIMGCDVQYVELQGQRWCKSHYSVLCLLLLQIKSSTLRRRASGRRRAEEVRAWGWLGGGAAWSRSRGQFERVCTCAPPWECV